MHRIVSLLPSATEILCELGFETQLVGVSHECDYPPSVQFLPKLTRSRIDGSGVSAEIQREVEAHYSEPTASSLFELDRELLKNLRPDIIVTQSQCQVCALYLNEVQQAVRELFDLPPQIITLNPTSLEEVWEEIRHVSEKLGVMERGELLWEALNLRLNVIRERVALTPERPRVVCLDWLDPLMGAGNWMPELVTLAGGESLSGIPGEHSPWMTWEQLRELDPDVIVAMPCGFGLARAWQEMESLSSRTGWSGLKAVRQGRVAVADGNAYFNRPGPRLVESVEILAEIFHPGEFDFGHQGTVWEWFPA